jgi:hypothetical protein
VVAEFAAGVALGIDFGSSNTAAAFRDRHGYVQELRLSTAGSLMPSAVFYDGSRFLVGRTASQAALVEELDHVSVSATPAEAVRLPPGADQATINDAAQRACLRCRRERLAAFSAAERQAWTVLERSYQLLFAGR